MYSAGLWYRPMIYGHGIGDGEKGLPGNVFYYQTLKANEVFEALDGNGFPAGFPVTF